MLKINRSNQSFSVLASPSLAEVSITERYDLQEYISNSPNAFFEEIGQELFLVGKEIEPSTNVQDRIDLLALDKEGTCVVVELKRGKHKLQMLQAISYAGMISQWKPEDFLHALDNDRQEALLDFLEVDLEEVNRQQRILLVAEAYDYALLISAEWLSKQFGVDITCCRIAIANDENENSEYLVCSNVYPAPELVNEAQSRGRSRSSTKTRWTNWDVALKDISNLNVVSYFETQLREERESYLHKRILRYRIDGKRRWFLAARQKNAYVWQNGRFPGDIAFWRDRLNQPEDVKEVKRGECLRLFLTTEEDFSSFHQAATKGLEPAEWLERTTDERFTSGG